ncbi:hypothetical protein [uncultured Treponema sp.]|uniref:hypothetical protein n=1 Tax=uncultured Treponema sp. TaxID=162155 RepID=UPI0025CC1131|nr:hypothetical protein [uncultured Treponema sp.]
MGAEEYYSSAKSLRKLFDSFAIIEEFYTPLKCYLETKIALQKYAFFLDKNLPYARDFKNLLIHFFVVIEGIYFYENYGFFSTRMNPKENPGLPVICQCGCLPSWPLEPMVDSFGHVIYKRVIRFYNKDRIRPLCMTISKNPEILEGREKCRLTDEQIEGLKAFVRKNRDLIRRHYREKLDSIDFIRAVQKRSSKNN